MLDRQREGATEGHGKQAQRGRILAEAIEGVHRCEEAAGERHVGGDDGAVREQNGLEDKERESEQGGEIAEHLPRREEDQQTQQEGEAGDDHAAPEEDGVGIRGIAVEQLHAAHAVLGFEVGDSWGDDGLAQAEGQEGSGGQQLREGWMLGVAAEVG